jgi:hypothetical protein
MRIKIVLDNNGKNLTNSLNLLVDRVFILYNLCIERKIFEISNQSEKSSWKISYLASKIRSMLSRIEYL